MVGEADSNKNWFCMSRKIVQSRFKTESICEVQNISWNHISQFCQVIYHEKLSQTICYA